MEEVSKIHLLLTAETYPEHFWKFIGYLTSRGLKDNPNCWDIAVREVKIFDIVFPAEMEKQVVGILQGIKKTGVDRHNIKMDKIAKMVQTFYPKIKPVDTNVPIVPFKEDFWIYLDIIGKISDKYWDPKDNDFHDEKKEDRIECL